jgi:uncharacterized membrane protein YvbJ
MAFCSSCGAPSTGGAFCSNCGKTVAPSSNQYQPSLGAVSPALQASAAKPSSIYSTLGMIFGGIAFLFFPIIFGPAGIVLSAIAKSKNEPNASLALGISIAGTVLGLLIGAFVTSSLY